MLSGLTSINLDAKGRLAIPTRYRSYLQETSGSKCCVTAHPDTCLIIYPLHEWTPVQRKLMKLSNMHRTTRDLQRMLIGYAMEIEMDSNGRILLSQSLRDFAGLDKTVVLVGVGNKFELWDEEKWNKRKNTWLSDGDVESSLTEEMQNLSI